MKMRWLGVVIVAAAIGCGDEGDGEGSVLVRVSGEGAAKVGYPYEKNGARIAFVDGFRVQFSKVLTSVAAVRLASADDRVALDEPGGLVVDLHEGDPVLYETAGIAARRWDRFSFRIVPPDASAKAVGEVDPSDLERMRAGGFAYWVEGTAERGGATYRFAWGLANPVRATNCTNGVDGTDGLVVRRSATTVAEITIHLDHLFWDTLGTEISKLRFEAIAAARGDDDVVTWEELGKQNLDDLRGLDGGPLLDEQGRRLVYDPGAVPLPDRTLQSFILATSASQAHLNGTGLCTVSRM